MAVLDGGRTEKAQLSDVVRNLDSETQKREASEPQEREALAERAYRSWLNWFRFDARRAAGQPMPSLPHPMYGWPSASRSSSSPSWARSSSSMPSARSSSP